jgi:hypothetical protein
MAETRLFFSSLTRATILGGSDLSSLPNLLATAQNVLNSPHPFTKAFIKTKDDDWAEFFEASLRYIRTDDKLLFLTATENLPSKVSGTRLDTQLDRIEKMLNMFVSMNVSRELNPWTRSQRSAGEQGENFVIHFNFIEDFKNELITYYNCQHPSDTTKVKCMVTGQYFTRKDVPSGCGNRVMESPIQSRVYFH